MKLKPEGRWILFFSIGLIILTSAPYIYAARQAGEDWEFTGFLFAVEDGNSYIAKMLNGAYGDWLFRSPYTSEEQAGALLYVPYLLLGKIIGASVSHADFVIAFHGFRAAAIFAVSFAMYAFISLFVSDRFYRRAGSAIALLGSGLGWMVLLAGRSEVFGSLPLEFYSPETFGFLGIFGIPHLAMARALLLWGLLLYLKPVKSIWIPVVVWFALALTHPLNAALGLLLISLHLIFLFLRNEGDLLLSTKPALPAFFGAGAIMVVNLLQYASDSYLQNWASQNLITSPHPVHYLLAYGLLLPFAIIGLRALWRREKRLATFAGVWLLALPFFLYIPFSLQRRFAEGAWVLHVCLALCSIESVTLRKRLYLLGLFTLTIPSTLGLILGAWQESRRAEPPVFRSANEVEALSFFPFESPKSIVLASYEIGNPLPAWSPVHVLLGHGPESIDFQRISISIEEFYSQETSDAARQNLIAEHGIDYVFWGPDERALGDWSPDSADYLDEVFSSEGYRIFRTVK
ncbi:MAG: hypothetical protein ACRDFQ_04120 [Anaerolineales bacterium]